MHWFVVHAANNLITTPRHCFSVLGFRISNINWTRKSLKSRIYVPAWFTWSSFLEYPKSSVRDNTVEIFCFPWNFIQSPLKSNRLFTNLSIWLHKWEYSYTGDVRVLVTLIHLPMSMMRNAPCIAFTYTWLI